MSGERFLPSVEMTKRKRDLQAKEGRHALNHDRISPVVHEEQRQFICHFDRREKSCADFTLDTSLVRTNQYDGRALT